MLQKAIIEKKIDKYSMKVRIPVYNKAKSDPTATPTDELYTAIIQTLPGCSPVYQEGDVVLVDFENDNLSFPVILGLLFRENMSAGATDIVADSLKVNVNTDLSENTLIGSVTPEAIKKLNDKYINNVKNVAVEYSLSNYQDHYDMYTSWSEQAPQFWPGKYMWQRTTVTYENGNIIRSMTCIQGEKGEPGSDITISQTQIKYAISSSSTTHPSTSAQNTWYDNPPQTTDVNPYLWSWTYVLYSDGTSTSSFGVSRIGANSTIVYLYKRSATVISQIDWSTNLTYNFDTKQFISLPTGWSDSIPSGNDPIYITAATVSSVQSTGTITPGQWSSPILFTKSGFNSKTIQLYKRANSTPSLPSSDVTYTFSTGAISPASPNGWSISVPTTTGNGNPCYVIQATAISYENTDTIISSEWSTPSVLVKDGNSDYIDQAVVEWYIATSTTSVPTTPTSDIEVASEWTTLGWTNNISSITLSTTNKYLWNAEVTHYSISGYRKTAAHIITVYAEEGKGISSIVEYYALSTDTTRPTTGWSTTLPLMDATNRYLWNYSLITYTDGSTSGSQSDGLIIGAYGESNISIEIQSTNGVLLNSKTTSTTLSADVHLGSTQLTVNSNGSVVSGTTNIGQLKWFAKESFTGNGVATTFDLGLDILNYSSTPDVTVTIDGVETSSYSISDENTIVFTTAPSNQSVIIIEYLTSTSSSVTIDKTDVRNQIVLTCKLVASSSTLSIAEVTVKDLNDASSIQNWYMLLEKDIEIEYGPTIEYDSSNYLTVPSGVYRVVGAQDNTEFSWTSLEPVVNQTTVVCICYYFQMIVFSDGSCSAGSIQRYSSFDSSVANYNSAESVRKSLENTNSTVDGLEESVNNVANNLRNKVDNTTFQPYSTYILFDPNETAAQNAFIALNTSSEDPNIQIGKGNFKQKLSSNRNSFLQDNKEVAWISSDQLYINSTTINKQLNLKMWSITFGDDGLVIKRM